MLGWWDTFPLKEGKSADEEQEHLVEDKKEEGSSRGEILNLVKATTKEVFVQESEEIQEEILTEVKNQPDVKPTVNEEKTPKMFAAALKSAPGQIKEFLNIVAEATGCALLCILGGPDPWEGSKAFLKFRETYLQPFTCFVRQAYPPEVRMARALTDFTPPAEVPAGVEKRDASVNVDEDVTPRDGETEITDGLDKDITAGSRKEPEELGPSGTELADEVGGRLRDKDEPRGEEVDPPTTNTMPESQPEHEHDREPNQSAPNPSICSSPAQPQSPQANWVNDVEQPTQESQPDSTSTAANTEPINGDVLGNVALWAKYWVSQAVYT
ncbi:uncharacterized protein EV420DRAFT_1480637 [Desarmillaria tabescens]|uniref:Uncharacterized protein n=1 Tax=Armillaria tabescens TaxID=1929756 RepID=A0AA39KCY4_ARMTA|nr:uncharacterized protein EV420DRAFT_1480637 [Desarmillaria tabescens]KAK0457571.1 hypothetical protein EV420DRAFT_1480637 [Desarmillaria tabescens]